MKKRRTRTPSLEARIKADAHKIYASGMAVAMNAAIGNLILEKFGELQGLLSATGYQLPSGVATQKGLLAPRAVTPPPAPVVENPCVQCGRPGVYKTKANQFNRTGSWYCRDHRGLGGLTDAEDQRDRALLGSQAPMPKAVPAIAQAAPAQMRQESVPAADPVLAALGMVELEPE